MFTVFKPLWAYAIKESTGFVAKAMSCRSKWQAAVSNVEMLIKMIVDPEI
jgi:hypothetical protein